MNLRTNGRPWAMPAFAGLLLALAIALGIAYAQEQGKTSYTKLDITEPFTSIMARMKAAKPAIEKRQADLLGERYDLSDRPAAGVTMERGKALQEGIRVKLPEAMTWEKLASMSPEEIREKNLFPKGFYPLPHPNHPEGGMLFRTSRSMRSRSKTGAISPVLTWISICRITFCPHFPRPFT
jgi:hypothetical protein